MRCNRLRISVLLRRVLILLTLLLISCGRADHEGADERPREQRLLEQNSLASELIEQLGTDLLLAGLPRSRVAAIQIGSEKAVEDAGAANSTQIGNLVSPIAKGAQQAMAELSTAAGKLAALEVMVKSLMTSLNGRAELPSLSDREEETWLGRLSSTVSIISSVRAPNTIDNTYSGILDSLVSTAVQNLNRMNLSERVVEEAETRERGQPE